MPPDFSYLLGAKPIELPDPLQQAGRMMQLQNSASAGKLSQLALQEAQQKMQTEQGLQRALPNINWDDPSSIRAAIQTDPSIAQQVLKMAQDRAKNKADVDAKNADTNAKQLDAKIKVWGAFGNQAHALAQDPNLDLNKIKSFYSIATDSGVDPKMLATPDNINDPAAWRDALTNFGNLSFSTAQQVADQRAKQGQAITMRGQDMTANTAQQGQQVTMRGQNMTDARARELRSDTLAQQGKPQIVTDANGNMFAVDPRTASGKPIVGDDGQPLNKGGKPLTEVQGNAAAFGARMQQANDNIDKLVNSGASLTSPSNLLAANAVTNIVASPNAQLFDQAKKNFMTAALRKESGASISQSEYDVFDKTYFPQVGDKPQVLAQKAALRQQAIQNMKTQAGPTGTKAIDSAGNSGKPRLGAVQQGYLFKGGDPADPKSWEKVSG